MKESVKGRRTGEEEPRQTCGALGVNRYAMVVVPAWEGPKMGEKKIAQF